MRRRLVLTTGCCSLAAAAAGDLGARAVQEAVSDSAPLGFAVESNRLVPLQSGEWEARLSAADVVLIGEHHNSVEDHVLELDVVRKLHVKAQAAARPFSVGMEMVQQKFQQVLDRYVTGKVGDQDFFRETEWSRRWSWPYELYLPIFQYCQQNGIRLVALNTDSETLGKVERGGLEELAPEEWTQYIPDRQGFAQMGQKPEFKAYLQTVIVPSYRLHERLGILQQTVTGQVLDTPMTLNHFVAGRLLWDETMAGAAVRAVPAPPAAGGSRARSRPQVCVLIGGDHVKYTYGVRDRVERLSRFQASTPNEQPLQVVSVMLNPTRADTLAPPGEEGLALQMSVRRPESIAATRLAPATALGAPGLAAFEPVPLADVLLFSQGSSVVQSRVPATS